MVQFAVGVPNVGEYGDPEVIVALAIAAESAGWDGLFLWDHLLYHDPVWPLADPTVTLSAVAAATRRLRIGVLMNALPRRRPWKVAREAISLDILSAGRLVIGAGLGSMPAEYESFGEESALRTRGEKLDESLELLAALWSGERVSFEGHHYRVSNVQMQRPVQRPRIPIWCAGRWPARAPFRRAAQWDGVMPTHKQYDKGETMTPEELREVVTYILAHRTSSELFDVALEGATTGDLNDRGGSFVRPYVEVGLTWWVEALGWWRGPVAAMERRVLSGPPDLSLP